MLDSDRMSKISVIARVLLAALTLVCLRPTAAWACAACYGQSDSAMARGFNWGILSLLGVVVMVLGGITTFFVFLGKKSAAVAAVSSAKPPATGRESPITDNFGSPPPAD